MKIDTRHDCTYFNVFLIGILTNEIFENLVKFKMSSVHCCLFNVVNVLYVFFLKVRNVMRKTFQKYRLTSSNFNKVAPSDTNFVSKPCNL